MTKTMKLGFVLCSLQIMLILVSGAKIKLFKDEDSSDLVWETNLTENWCLNVPHKYVQDLRSLTTDTCFIAYVYPDCLPKLSYKYTPGKTLITTKNIGYSLTNGLLRSLHLCNDQEGGPQLNVDLTTFIDHQNPKTIPEILESYSNVCTCVNIPKYVQDTSKWSIDNHGNGLFAYNEPDCKETDKETNWQSKGVYIEAGLWLNSWEMNKHTKTFRGITRKIQSFGPDVNSTYFLESCLSHRHDQIMRLELLEAMNSTSSQLDPKLNETRTSLTTGANHDLLHFFADNDFQGYHFGSRSMTKCNNFPKPVQHRWVDGIGSIKTKICVILFSALDCMERSVKIDAPGTTNLTSVWESTVTGQRTLSILYTQHPNWKWETKSYRVCNKEEGGFSIQVDILSNDPTVEPIHGPVVLESYPYLCSCRNVPEYIQQLDRWFINNHGNALVAYFSPDCSSTSYSPLWIPAGQSSFSFGLGSFKQVDPTGIIHKIQSFGPDRNAGYFQRSCNNNSTTLSLPGQGITTSVNLGSFFYSNDATDSTLVGFLYMQVINELQQISRKVDEIKQINQQTGFDFENVKSFVEGKLQKQKSEFKNLTNKIKHDLNDLFA